MARTHGLSLLKIGINMKLKHWEKEIIMELFGWKKPDGSPRYSFDKETPEVQVVKTLHSLHLSSFKSASIAIDIGGLGLIKFDKSPSIFRFVFFASDSLGGPKNINQVNGHTCIIENDEIKIKGTIKLDESQHDELWFKLIEEQLC